jgi:leucyl aminopeptidase
VIDLTIAPLERVDTEILAFPVFEDDNLLAVPGLDEASGGEFSHALHSGELRGKLFQVLVTGAAGARWCARRLLAVGAGPSRDYDSDRARKIAATAGIWARERRVERLAFWHRVGGQVDASSMGESQLVDGTQAIAEGLSLARFSAAQYKTRDKEPSTLQELLVVLPGLGDSSSRLAARSIAKGGILGRCTNLARELANEPGNHLPPRVFAERAANLASDAGVDVEVLDEGRIAELGMGLLLGVARGSAEPPRVVVIRYEPPGAPESPVLGLVGKGITFDAGGISIKPAPGMDQMKDDMAGGAAVVAAIRAAAELGAPTRIVGIVPSAENMPDGRALKPGDVLISASGKTVEVVDTDGEGRLVLGDGLWYAQRLGATHLVDVATLTGACVVALGKIVNGIFGRPVAWVEHVRRVADRAGDRAWPMPLFDEYREQLNSEVADLVNSGGRPAGAVTAAMFLKEFAGDRPWAHIDIAGTAWNDEVRPYLPKGPSGAGVRTLAELAFTAFP